MLLWVLGMLWVMLRKKIRHKQEIVPRYLLVLDVNLALYDVVVGCAVIAGVWDAVVGCV